MTRSDTLSFTTTPYFLGTVGVVVGLFLAFGDKGNLVAYMAMFTGWICLCLAGTNTLLVRILNELGKRDAIPTQTEVSEKNG